MKLYNNIGMLHMNSGDLDLALNYFDNAYDLSEKFGNKLYSGAIKLNAGQIYSNRGNFSAALNNLEESKQIFEEMLIVAGTYCHFNEYE